MSSDDKASISKDGGTQKSATESSKDSDSGQNQVEVIECKTDAMTTAGGITIYFHFTITQHITSYKIQISICILYRENRLFGKSMNNCSF